MTPSETRSFDALYRQFHPKSNYAVSVLKPEKLGILLEKADKETDPGKLGAYVQDIVRIMYEEALCCPLYMSYHIAVENPKCVDTGVYDESRTFKVYMTLEDAWKRK
jgi:hypothetical protein